MLQCNYCNNKNCNLIHAEFDKKRNQIKFRMEHPIIKYGNRICKSYRKINRSNLTTLFEVAFNNNPNNIYRVLKEFNCTIHKGWGPI